jgi:hypothetical protein
MLLFRCGGRLIRDATALMDRVRGEDHAAQKRTSKDTVSRNIKTRSKDGKPQ